MVRDMRHSRLVSDQLSIFAAAPAYPEGFRYAPDVISVDAEHAALAQVCTLPFREFEFHGYVGKRRVISFGWRYDFATESLREADALPSWLLPLRECAARFAGIAPDDLGHALVTEYQPGAAIGWHRDKAVFGDVIGISLVAPCTFRLRRKGGPGWERVSLVAEPRSAYLLRGVSRSEWEHSIPAVDALRYSITFRSVRSAK